MDCTSTLDLKIKKFIIQYGAEQLIDWLDEFDCMGGPVKFRQFKMVEKLSCAAFGITIADMHNLSNTRCTNSKKLISFVAVKRINLPILVVSKLLGGTSLRSISYYIKDAELWISNPRLYNSFADAYNKVIEKFNSELP
jgi:hypothetical protein